MPTTYTSPPTFTATVVTVADMNTYVRDNTKHLYETKGSVRDVRSESGTYTATVTDGLILCTGTFTVTLPAAATAGEGHVLHIKNVSTGTITVDGNGAETIDGATTTTITVQYASVTLCCDGSNWHII